MPTIPYIVQVRPGVSPGQTAEEYLQETWIRPLSLLNRGVDRAHYLGTGWTRWIPRDEASRIIETLARIRNTPFFVTWMDHHQGGKAKLAAFVPRHRNYAWPNSVPQYPYWLDMFQVHEQVSSLIADLTTNKRRVQVPPKAPRRTLWDRLSED